MFNLFANLKTSLFAIALVAAVSACGSSAPLATVTALPKPTVAPVKLEISSKGEEMSFDKVQLEVKSGAQVTLRFVNTSAAQMHNWVLVKTGQADIVASDGASAGEANDYLVKGDKRVLAATHMVKPKETAEITFTASAPGSYPFICTFPGHAAVMRGVLVVN